MRQWGRNFFKAWLEVGSADFLNQTADCLEEKLGICLRNDHEFNRIQVMKKIQACGSESGDVKGTAKLQWPTGGSVDHLANRPEESLRKNLECQIKSDLFCSVSQKHQLYQFVIVNYQFKL